MYKLNEDKKKLKLLHVREFLIMYALAFRYIRDKANVPSITISPSCNYVRIDRQIDIAEFWFTTAIMFYMLLIQ
jgi:hypothetical protein